MATSLLLAVLGASALVTSFISGILGMAGGMILIGILFAVMPVPAAMMLHGITQLASNVGRAYLWRRAVDWRVFRGYCYGAVAPVAVFAAVQVVVGKPVALIVLGLTPFVALALPERLHLNVERRGHPFACGAVCTALSLTSGISGQILDVFFVRSKLTRQAVVATKAMTQSLSHAVKIAYFGALLTSGPGNVAFGTAAMMVVLAFVGTSLSRSILDRMNDEAFRFWTRWAVIVISAFYLASGVTMLLR